MAASVPRFLDQLRPRRYSIRTGRVCVDRVRHPFAHLRGLVAEREALERRIDALREPMQSDELVGKRPAAFVAPAPD